MGRAQRNPSPANPSPPLTHLDGGLCNPTPILRQPSLGHIPMQRRIRPIHGPPDVSMFHRIEVDVIDVALPVVLVADQMLPTQPLPDPAFAFGAAACAAMLPTQIGRAAGREWVGTFLEILVVD